MNKRSLSAALLLLLALGCTSCNFLEYPTMAKISRSMNDLRSMATGIEAYMVDKGQYPPTLECITTPVAYLSSVYPDPFSKSGAKPNYHRKQHGWILWSMGPDKQFNMTHQLVALLYDPAPSNPFATYQDLTLYPKLTPYMYDPTNGTVSQGDIIRIWY